DPARGSSGGRAAPRRGRRRPTARDWRGSNRAAARPRSPCAPCRTFSHVALSLRERKAAGPRAADLRPCRGHAEAIQQKAVQRGGAAALLSPIEMATSFLSRSEMPHFISVTDL